jgi:hypothetical protein
MSSKKSQEIVSSSAAPSSIELVGEKTYSEKEYKGVRIGSAIGGGIAGIALTLLTGVVLNKVAHVNITDATSNLIGGKGGKGKKCQCEAETEAEDTTTAE